MSWFQARKAYFVSDVDETWLPGEYYMEEQLKERCANSVTMSKKTKHICECSLREHLAVLRDEERKLNNQVVDLQNAGMMYSEAMVKTKKDLERIRKDIIEHYKCKDIVREEIYPEFVGLINYPQIYVPENFYPGVLEALWAIYKIGIYPVMAANSQTNSPPEEIAKDSLKSALPPRMEMFYRRFHELPYINPDGTKNEKRVASDKWQSFVDTHPDIDFSSSSCVENMPNAYEKALSLGFKGALVQNEQCLPGDPRPCEALVYAANEMIALRYHNIKEPIDIKTLIKR